MSGTTSTTQRRLAGLSISVVRSWQRSFESVADIDDLGGKPRANCDSPTWLPGLNGFNLPSPSLDCPDSDMSRSMWGPEGVKSLAAMGRLGDLPIAAAVTMAAKASHAPSLSSFAPGKPALQTLDPSLGQLVDQRLDPQDRLPSPAFVIRCCRRRGPRRAPRSGKCRKHPTCQCRDDAPAHGGAQVQEIQACPRRHGRPCRVRLDRGPRRLLLDVAVRQHPKSAGLGSRTAKLEAFMAAAQEADAVIDRIGQRLLRGSGLPARWNAGVKGAAGKAGRAGSKITEHIGKVLANIAREPPEVKID